MYLQDAERVNMFFLHMCYGCAIDMVWGRFADDNLLANFAKSMVFEE